MRHHQKGRFVRVWVVVVFNWAWKKFDIHISFFTTQNRTPDTAVLDFPWLKVGKLGTDLLHLLRFLGRREGIASAHVTLRLLLLGWIHLALSIRFLDNRLSQPMVQSLIVDIILSRIEELTHLSDLLLSWLNCILLGLFSDIFGCRNVHVGLTSLL